MKGDTLETLRKIAKKVSQSRKNLHKKVLVKGETRTHVLRLGRPQKNLINLYAQLTLVVWQLEEASL